MKHLLYAFLVSNALTLLIQPAEATTKKANPFIGMWRGIDNSDGSISYLSISDANNDGVISVRLDDSFISRCKDAGYSPYPGMIEGTGTVKNYTLTMNYASKCYDPATNKLVEIKSGTTKVEYNSKGHFLIDEEGEIYNPI